MGHGDDHEHGRGHREPYDHEHPHEQSHGHDHSHEHDHSHGHDHGHPHDHDHNHLHGSGFWAQVKYAIVPHSHDHVEKAQSADEARADGIRTAWIGLVGMLAIAAAQILIVWISGSVGLLADTVHSISHAVTTIPLIIAFRLGARAATSRLPYGYHRFEDIVGIFISLVVFGVALLIGWEAIDGLRNPEPLQNLGWAFAAGLVGFIGNEVIAEYRIRGGKRIGSAALIAEGQHARADGFTSLAVVLGIVGAWLGYPQADSVVGLIIALMIFGIMLASLRTTVMRLMDGVEPGLLDSVTETVLATEGVCSAIVRARWSGHRMFAEAHIGVDPDLTVAQADQVSAAARDALETRLGNVERTVVELVPAR